MSGGDFTTIEQDGGVQQIATPYDMKMAELNDKLDRTGMVYGDDTDRRRYESKMGVSAAAAPAAKADRASVKSVGSASMDDSDAVAKYESGKLNVATMKEENLPAELKGKSAKEREAVLAAKAKERKAIQAELVELAKKRDAHLRKEAESSKAEGGFDAKVRASIDKSLKSQPK